NMQLLGINALISTTSLPLNAGTSFRIYVGGHAIDQIATAGLSISSPLMTVVADSLQPQEFHTPYPVISFEVTVASSIQPGDYSIRLQSAGGEFTYLAGAITIE